jgi:hypothetical protein
LLAVLSLVAGLNLAGIVVESEFCDEEACMMERQKKEHDNSKMPIWTKTYRVRESNECESKRLGCLRGF